MSDQATSGTPPGPTWRWPVTLPDAASFPPHTTSVAEGSDGLLTSGLAGFHAGCDDYVVKPFSMAELLVRVRAVLRRAGLLDSGVWQVDDLVVGSHRGAGRDGRRTHPHRVRSPFPPGPPAGAGALKAADPHRGSPPRFPQAPAARPYPGAGWPGAGPADSFGLDPPADIGYPEGPREGRPRDERPSAWLC